MSIIRNLTGVIHDPITIDVFRKEHSKGLLDSCRVDVWFSVNICGSKFLGITAYTTIQLQLIPIPTVHIHKYRSWRRIVPYIPVFLVHRAYEKKDVI